MTSIAMLLQGRQDNNSGYYGGGLDGTGNSGGNGTEPADGWWSPVRLISHPTGQPSPPLSPKAPP